MNPQDLDEKYLFDPLDLTEPERPQYLYLPDTPIENLYVVSPLMHRYYQFDPYYEQSISFQPDYSGYENIEYLDIHSPGYADNYADNYAEYPNSLVIPEIPPLIPTIQRRQRNLKDALRKKEKIPCPQCGKILARNDMAKHKRRCVNTDNPEPYFTCPQCGIQIKRLREHLMKCKQ